MEWEFWCVGGQLEEFQAQIIEFSPELPNEVKTKEFNYL
jgi:hypothetical protein